MPQPFEKQSITGIHRDLERKYEYYFDIKCSCQFGGREKGGMPVY